MTAPGRRRVPSLIALKGAERHSRIVRMMRVILPAVALLVIGVVMLQAFMYRADDTLKLSFADAGPVADDLKMVQPEFSARFGQNPFRFNAESAYRDEEKPGRVIMEKIQGDVSIEGVTWLSLAAAKGVLDTEAVRVVLGGGIDLFSDLGYELHTKSVNIDLRDGVVTGRTEVAGQGPAGTLRADGFSIRDDGSRIRFDGNVRMTLPRPARPSG